MLIYKELGDESSAAEALKARREVEVGRSGKGLGSASTGVRRGLWSCCLFFVFSLFFSGCFLVWLVLERKWASLSFSGVFFGEEPSRG